MPKWAQRLLYVLSTLIVLWLVIYIAFRTPAVQNYLTGLVEDKASNMLNTKVSLGGIDIDFLDQIVLEDVYIEDQQGDTLLYSGKLDVAFDPLAAIGKTISIDHIILADTYINLYQLQGKDTLNFEFIPQAFASDTTTQNTQDTTSSSWNIQAGELLLSNIRFNYEADSTVMNLALHKLKLLFDKIELEEQLIKAQELNIDGLAFNMQLPRASETDSTQTEEQAADTTDSNIINPSGYAFELSEILIANSEIGYQVGQIQQDSASKQMNFENLALSDIQLEVEDVKVGAKDVSLNLPLLAFVEKNSGFRLEELAAVINMQMPQIALQLKELRTGHSELNGKIDYSMQLAENTAELMNSISLKSDLNKTVLGLEDVSYFSDALSMYPNLSQMKAFLSWQINMEKGSGIMDRLELSLSDKATLLAEASFENLSALDSATEASPYFNFNLNEFSTDYAFLSTLVADSTARYFSKLQQKSITLSAQLKGKLDDIEGNANLQTGIGELLAQGNYQSESSEANIKANIEANRFDLRALMLALGNPDSVARAYGNLSMSADIKATQSFGQDTTLSNARANLLVKNLGYKGHQYKGLQLKGQKNYDDITAQVDYADSLLEMHANAQASLKGESSQYQFNLSLENANLFRLNLIPDSVIINNTRMTAEARGNTIDNIVGSFKVTESNVIKGADSYQLDSLVLVAEETSNGRAINFYSDYVNAGINGKFSLATLPTAIEDFRQYYMSAYEAPLNNVDTINTDETNQEFFITLEVKDTPILARAFMPSLTVAKPINANAYFNSDRKKLTFRFYAPNVIYQDYSVDSLLLTAQTSQRALKFITKSDFIRLGGLTIPEVGIRGNLSGVPQDSLNENRQHLFATEVDLNLKVGAEGAPYRLDLNTVLKNSKDTITISLDPSELVLEEKPWEISPNTQITYAANYLAIDSFYFKQDDQRIEVNTKNQEGKTNLALLIDQLAVGPLLASLDLDDYMIDGTLNADASMQDVFQRGDLQSQLSISNLKVRDLPVGNLNVKAQGDQLAAPEAGEPLQLEMKLDGEASQLSMEGDYRLDSGYFDFDINMDRFQLEPWQTFMTDYVEELSGTLKASLKLKGTAQDPTINGTFTFADEVSLVPSITGAQYYINDQDIAFDGTQLLFDNFTILDSARTEAQLDGTISFADMTNPELDLSFETDNFQFVNSESFQNESFYGRAHASASIDIKGSVNDLSITGDAAINEGTDMTIALIEEADEASTAEYIHFVNATSNAFAEADSTAVVDSTTIVSNADSLSNTAMQVNGMSVSTNVRISPEAQLTILIDPVNGDKITASGDADLNVNMSPAGDVNVQGTYVIEDGAYILTFAQFIQKEFAIREGSTLSWSGDPANARFDITAVYTAETTLEDLVSANYRDVVMQDAQSRSYVTTRQPVNVLMNISGELSDPELSFDIEIPELTASGMSAQVVQNLIDDMEQDETQLYKQVFSLIVLNRFLPAGGGFGSGGGSTLTTVNQRIDNSLSRLLSSTLSGLSEDYLGGIQINLNLESDELQAQNTALADRDLNVQLSREFFNDRLTVSAGGMTSLNTNSTGGGNSDNQFYGEFEVLYRLDASGNLNVRIFQTSERDIFTNDVDIRQGVSLTHQKAFDEFFANNDQVLESKPRSEDEEEDSEEQGQSSDSTALDNAQRRKKTKN